MIRESTLTRQLSPAFEAFAMLLAGQIPPGQNPLAKFEHALL
jgi:hypothetical protein